MCEGGGQANATRRHDAIFRRVVEAGLAAGESCPRHRKAALREAVVDTAARMLSLEGSRA